MRAKDKIMVKATVEQSLFLSMPKNYSPEVQFFGTNKPQESHEFFCEIIDELAARGYPAYLAYFCTPDYIENRQDLLDNFYHFLAFTVVDRRYESICKDNNYKDERYKKSFAECMNILNKIATDIIRFSIKFQLGDKCDTEIIKSFFEGEFFKILDKNTFIMDTTQKSLLEEVAKTFFLSIRSPELFSRVKILCETLLQEVNRVTLFEDVSQCEIRKNRCSKGGSKRFSKYDATIPNDRKEEIYQEYKNKHPEMIKKYKNGENKRMVISGFHGFFMHSINKGADPKIIKKGRTTLNWIRELLDSHIND